MNKKTKSLNLLSSLSDKIYEKPPETRQDADFIALHPKTFDRVRRLIPRPQEEAGIVDKKYSTTSCWTLMGYKTVRTRDVKRGEVRFLKYTD